MGMGTSRFSNLKATGSSPRRRAGPAGCPRYSITLRGRAMKLIRITTSS